MTGITGGVVDDRQLRDMLDSTPRRATTETTRLEAGEYGVGLVHHGQRDPAGYSVWNDGQRIGLIDGAVTNRTELGWSVQDLFERLLSAPERTLRTIEGPFTLVCVDAAADRVLLATDKIGCRTPYYSTDDGFQFASSLGPLLTVLPDPEIDEQGVSDLLLVGNMWSDTTLLSGVKALHPATVLEYTDGEVSRHRYWHPDYTPTAPSDAYLFDLTTAFQRSVDRTARSMDGEVGLWLSGGLDSRATAGSLARSARESGDLASITTYTYDANPGGGVNPRLASETADALELANETVPLSADRFLPVLEDAVEATSGMVKWNTFLNLTAAYNIEGQTPEIMLEGLEGALVGHHLSRHHLTGTSSLVESMYQSEAALSKAAVSELLDISVDPLGSFRAEAARVDEPTMAESVLDTHYQNYYARVAHASNQVPRTLAGTRVPYADGEFLSTAAKLPLSWRMGALPFSDGKLIYGVVKPKLRLVRALDSDLAEIPYERSRLKPSYPFPLHVAGFFASTALAQLRSNPTYGGKSMTAQWYRNHDGLRETLNDLIDDACDRRYFDADTVRAYQERTLSGEGSEMSALSAITTLELWLQNSYEPLTGR